jgi:hypothetical protein
MRLSRHQGVRALRRSGALGVILLVTLLPSPGGAAAPSEAMGGDPAAIGARLREMLLGGPGPLLICPECPREPALRVDVATGASTEVQLPYEQVHQIAAFPDGKRLLAATSSEKGKRGLLLVLSAESLAPLGRVEIPGSGERIAIARDGYTAYLLCRRAGRTSGDPEGGKWELVAVDLGGSVVRESFPLPGAASDLALAEGGSRLFVAMEGKVASFTTSPLSSSWFYRSPGDNRRLFIRPGQGEIYVLRGSSVAVFTPEPAAAGGSPADRTDDAAWVLEPPSHLERIGFSADGRLAVGAGRATDTMVLFDAESRRLVGTWPEDSTAIGALMEGLAAAARPKGPRGKLTGTSSGFSPPMQPPPRPGAPVPRRPSYRTPESGPASSAQGAGDVSPGPAAAPRRSPPGETPGPESSRSPSKPETATAASPAKEATPPPAPAPPAAGSVLEEVAEPILSGRILGERSLVSSLILFGPNSLTLIQDQVTPAPDGGYSFKLPAPGRYRIVPVAAPQITLACRPPFQTVQVGEYGYRGLDFDVRGAIGVAPRH